MVTKVSKPLLVILFLFDFKWGGNIISEPLGLKHC